jgi:hypothetical protein
MNGNFLFLEKNLLNGISLPHYSASTPASLPVLYTLFSPSLMLSLPLPHPPPALLNSVLPTSFLTCFLVYSLSIQRHWSPESVQHKKFRFPFPICRLPTAAHHQTIQVVNKFNFTKFPLSICHHSFFIILFISEKTTQQNGTALLPEKRINRNFPRVP